MGIFSKAKSVAKSVTKKVGSVVTVGAKTVAGAVSTGVTAVASGVSSAVKSVTSSPVRTATASSSNVSRTGGTSTQQSVSSESVGRPVQALANGGVLTDRGIAISKEQANDILAGTRTGGGRGGGGGGGTSSGGETATPIRDSTGNLVGYNDTTAMQSRKATPTEIAIDNYAKNAQIHYQNKIDENIKKINNFSSLPTYQQQKIIDNELAKANQGYEKSVNTYYEAVLKRNYPGSTIAPMSTSSGAVYDIASPSSPSSRMTNLLVSGGEQTSKRIYNYDNRGGYDYINEAGQSYHVDKSGKTTLNYGGGASSAESLVLAVATGGKSLQVGRLGLLATGFGAAKSELVAEAFESFRPKSRISQLGFDVGIFSVPGVGAAYTTNIVKSLVKSPMGTVSAIKETIYERPEILLIPSIQSKLRGIATRAGGSITGSYVPVKEGILPDGSPYKYTEVTNAKGVKIKILLQEPGVLPKIDILEQLKQNSELKGERFYVHTSPELIKTSGGKLVVDIDRGLYSAPENILNYQYNPSVLKTAEQLGIQSPTLARIPKLNSQQKAILEVVIKRGDIVGGSFAQKTLFPNARKFGDIDVLSRSPMNTAVDIAKRLGPNHRVLKGSEGKYSVVNTRTNNVIVDIAPTNSGLYRTNLLGDVPSFNVGGGLKVLDPYALRDIKVKTIQRAPMHSKIKAAKDIEFLTKGKAKAGELLRPTKERIPQALLHYGNVGGERMGLLKFLVKKARGEDIQAKFTLTSSGRAGIQILAEKAPKVPKWVSNGLLGKTAKTDLKTINYWSRKFDANYKPTTKFPTSNSWVESVITGGGRKGLTASVKQIRIAKSIIEWSRTTKQGLIGGPELMKGLQPYGPEAQIVEPFGKVYQKVSPSFREKAYKLFGMERGRKFTLVGGQPVEISFFEPVKITKKIVQPKESYVTFYHGTDVRSALSILRNGFREGSYLTRNLNTVYEYVGQRTADTGGVILEIKIPKSQLNDVIGSQKGTNYNKITINQVLKENIRVKEISPPEEYYSGNKLVKPSLSQEYLTLKKIKGSQARAAPSVNRPSTSIVNKYLSNSIGKESSQLTRGTSRLGRREVAVQLPRPRFPAKAEYRKTELETQRQETRGFSLVGERWNMRNIRVRDFELRTRPDIVRQRPTQQRTRPAEVRIREPEFRLLPPRVEPPRPPRTRPPRIPPTKIRTQPPRPPRWTLTPPKPPVMRKPHRREKIIYAKSKTTKKGRGYIIQPTIAGISFGLVPRRRKRLSQITGFEILR